MGRFDEPTMISFKNFIEYMLSESWKVEDYESKIYGKKLYASNHTNIDGHEVRLHFSGDDKKNFTAQYMVNDSYYKNKNMSAHSGKKIVNHVGKSINTFVRHMKPNRITFSSKESNKISLHDALTKRLARKFNGKTSVSYGPELTHHTVEFMSNK